MHAVTLFVIVAVAFCATCGLYLTRPLDLYLWCMAFQVATLVGIPFDNFVLIQAGHVGFAVLLYVGALTLPSPDVWLVYVLCSVALLTRRLFRGCLFDMITNRSYTHTLAADVFFFLPILLNVSLGSRTGTVSPPHT